ncbi:MAG TPA: hypothetical protein VE954_12280 [Oligoflexus sp.]|uniref:hypothetical protein n=1 Tax=Oligoflexus sp. TaxID=1971216 RepID=UPI002D34DA23|nr:hypothetical protein [Oligoflexus sp.]HYX33884.1 hypothetical protein [Oligoflexus sp.]
MRFIMSALCLFLLFEISACSKKRPPKPESIATGNSLDAVPLGADLVGGLRANQYQDLGKFQIAFQSIAIKKFFRGHDRIKGFMFGNIIHQLAEIHAVD